MPTERQINGKNAIVTGGVSGIGLAIAEEFLDNGLERVALLDTDVIKGPEVAQSLSTKYGSGKAIFVRCDVTSELEVNEAFDQVMGEFQEIHVVVNSAGVVEKRDWKQVIDINLHGLVASTLKAWSVMRTDRGGGGGTVINISSIYGIRISPLMPIYLCTKHAVVAFSKSLGMSFHYNRTGVRILTLCPGFTETPFQTSANMEGVDDETGDAVKNLSDIKLQKVNSVATGALEVFQRGDSGTVWLMENDEPAVEV